MAAKKKTSKGAKPLTKTAFVRALPVSTPAKDVVERAKAKGIEISEAYVYEIRSAAKRSKKAAKPSSKKAGRKKGAGKRGPTKGASTSKREFIESLPVGTPVAEVVAAAKKAGLSLSSNYVYVLRGGSKKKAKNRTPAHSSSTAGSSEGRFVDLVAEIGLGRADELLAEFRAKLKTIKVG